MRTTTRLDGECQLCASPFQKEAFQLTVDTIEIQRYVDGTERVDVTKGVYGVTICPQCYFSLKRKHLGGAD